MWAFFVSVMVAVCLTILVLLRKYADKRVSLVVRVTTAYAWLTSMWVVALVPLDSWQTLKHSTDHPRVPDPNDTAIKVMWGISYWSTQVLTWLLLPFFQVYADAGDFTVSAKCWTSFKENMILYGLAALAGVIGFIILLAQRGLKQLASDHLEALGVTMSNTFGLVAGILLLGYGLVQLPRLLFKSQPEALLKWSAHRSGRLAEQVLKTTKELDTVVTIIYANQKQMPRRDPLRVYMDIVAQDAEDYSPVKPSQMEQRNVDMEGLSADDLDYNYDKDGLARLRRRLHQAVSEYKGAHAQYELAIRQAFELEDVVKARANGEYSPPNGQTQWWAKLLWQYKCLVRPWAMKVVAFLLAGLGAVIVWSECTIFTGRNPDLSPFSIIIRKVRGDEAVQLLVAIPLVYVCVCSYFALFALNAFNYNRLMPNATTGVALMQNGSLMARFAAPTCWNYFHMIRLASDGAAGTASEETQFSKMIMGQVSDGQTSIGFFNNLNVYLPLILIVHCSLVWFNVFDRIANMCVPAKYKFSSDDDVEDTYTEKGRALIRREQEAVSRGFRIGEVLHSEYLDLDNNRAQKQAKKGWFSWMRGGATQNESEAAGAAGESASSAPARGRYAMAGAEATTGTVDGSSSSFSLRLPFMSNKFTPSPSSQASDGSRGSGLDGIFASVQTRAPARAPTGRRMPLPEEDDDDRTPLTMGRWGR